MNSKNLLQACSPEFLGGYKMFGTKDINRMLLRAAAKRHYAQKATKLKKQFTEKAESTAISIGCKWTFLKIEMSKCKAVNFISNEIRKENKKAIKNGQECNSLKVVFELDKGSMVISIPETSKFIIIRNFRLPTFEVPTKLVSTETVYSFGCFISNIQSDLILKGGYRVRHNDESEFDKYHKREYVISW